MPQSPNKVKRPWQKEYEPHQRIVDNSWFYNDWRWRKFRKSFIERNPICVMCENENVIKPAKVVDHIVRYAAGGEGFDLNNLKDEYFQSLCEYHHNKKSGKEAHGFIQKK